ncbi:MAG TPA: AI-2E family transporter [Rubrivivax sp.]|nr:AI-2E family transporter [Rubrivivax sp.]
MNEPVQPDSAQVPAAGRSMLDVLIRAGLILILAYLCYWVLAPFLVLVVWAVILAVAMYPLHRAVTRRIGGRQGLAATLITVLAVVLIVVPTAALLNSLGDSVRQLITDVQQDSLRIPPPRPGLSKLPLLGDKVHAAWQAAHDDLPALVRSLQPKIGDLAKGALAMVASIGGGILQFLAALIIAGIIMAFGEGGARASRAIFARLADEEHGAEYTHLATSTIRAVAQGVIGVAFIQALAIGICLLVAGVPWAGVLAIAALVVGIAQVPVLLVTLPAIAYLWLSGDYGSVEATLYTVLLAVSGLIDNVLKPLMLGHGVDAPMPVILLGALGGMAAAGILGMFVGATLLALGYQVFMGWVGPNARTRQPEPGQQRERKSTPAPGPTRRG